MVVEFVQQLRTYDIERIQTEDALALLTLADLLRAKYEAKNFTVPEWLDDRIRQLNRHIEMHRRDSLERRLVEIRAQEAALLTPTERREKLAAEKAAVEAALAQA